MSGLVDIDPGINSYVNRLENYLADVISGEKGLLGEMTRYALQGSGKRVRPLLVMLASELEGQADAETVNKIAVAVEMIHVATLVHDDVVDGAQIRRQRATFTRKYGEDVAILAGDLIYVKAFKLISDTGRTELINELSQATADMCRGEIQQMSRRFGFELGEAEYFSFIELKTASLFSASCAVGGLLANLTTSKIEALRHYGINLGIAFQLIDDLIDLIGDENVVGKTLGTDINNGKMTLPLIHLRHNITKAEWTDLTANILGSPEQQFNGFNGNKDFARLCHHMDKAGSFEYVRECAREALINSQQALEPFNDSEGKNKLIALSKWILQRDR